MAHKARQDDGAEVAAAVGRKWLFAAVVYIQTIGVERMDIGDGDIEHLFNAFFVQRLDGGGEALAVQAALIAAQGLRQPLGLGGVGKADAFSIDAQVVTADDQFVLCLRLVELEATAPVGQKALLSQPAVLVDCRGNAQAQQHALRRLQQRQITLG